MKVSPSQICFAHALRSRTAWQRARIFAVAALCVLLFLISGTFHWSPLNCRHEDIDINSGRIRSSRYLLYIRVNDEIRETWISRNSEPIGSPDWRRVNTFSPAVGHSPHYLYHGAIAQNKELAMLDELAAFSPRAKRKVATDILRTWQSGNDMSAEAYIQQLADIILTRHQLRCDRDHFRRSFVTRPIPTPVLQNLK